VAAGAGGEQELRDVVTKRPRGFFSFFFFFFFFSLLLLWISHSATATAAAATAAAVLVVHNTHIFFFEREIKWPSQFVQRG